MVGYKNWLLAGLAFKAMIKGALSFYLKSIVSSNIRNFFVKNGENHLPLEVNRTCQNGQNIVLKAQ